MNEMAKVRESKGTDAAAVKKAIELCAKRDDFYKKINDLLQKSIKLQVEIISTMSKVRSSSEKDTAADKEQLALALKKAIELCENRSELYKKPDVFAMRSQKWYHDSRKLDDYMGPPSQAFRDAAGIK
jgi:shikimate kinase